MSLGCGRFRKETLPIDVRKATSRENFTVFRTVTLRAVANLAKTVKNLLDTLAAEVRKHVVRVVLYLVDTESCQ